MNNTIKTNTSEHLANVVLNRNDDVPSYALLLGAGASAFCNIPTADDLISKWRRKLYENQKISMRYSTWLHKQSWYNSDEEYSILFGKLYDEKAQRRDFIEKCLKDSTPSWGYVYLTSLLEFNIFNTVLTTNFDDLINECCYIFSDKVRPVVCAHDMTISNIRITKKRAKIIKLHGDFLFDNIKNTSTEVDKLEKNMEAKIAQLGQEYGLVVIGYGGRDNSIMSILEKLTDEEQYFKHGIYWCLKKGEIPRKRVMELLKKGHVHGMEIDGFDQLMATIHHNASLPLPDFLINPMRVARLRSEVFCSVPDTLRQNNIIRKDISKVMDSVTAVSFGAGTKTGKIPLVDMPNEVKAAILKEQGDYNSALKYMELAIYENSENLRCAYNYADLLRILDKKDELKKYLGKSPLGNDNKSYFMLFTGDDNGLIEFADKALEKEPENYYIRINRAIAYKRLNNRVAMNKDLKIIEEMKPNDAIIVGIAALRKNKQELFPLLDTAIKNKWIGIDNLLIFPVFEDYINDADFLHFIESRKKLK